MKSITIRTTTATVIALAVATALIGAFIVINL